jgi:hypothetical protein
MGRMSSRKSAINLTLQSFCIAAISLASGCGESAGSLPANVNSAQTHKARQEFLNQCGSNLTQAQYERLLALTDVTTFQNYEEAADRASAIAEIFAEAGDRRGVFSSMYVEITKESVRTAGLNAGADSYENPELAQALVKRFADLYFEPLHNWLLLGQVGVDAASVSVDQKWETYYELAADCAVSQLQLLGTGVNNHMTYDLPYALRDIGAPDSFKADFFKFGEILIRKEEASTNLLQRHHGINAVPFFNLYLDDDNTPPTIGPLKFDPSKFGFRYVRLWSWTNSRGLLNTSGGVSKYMAQRAIDDQWLVRQKILEAVPIIEFLRGKRSEVGGD